MSNSFGSLHRGPFALMVRRPHPVKTKRERGFFVTEWLKGETSIDDVEDESLALLSDPLDTIDNVQIYSLSENQFVMSYSTRDVEQAQVAA